MSYLPSTNFCVDGNWYAYANSVHMPAGLSHAEILTRLKTRTDLCVGLLGTIIVWSTDHQEVELDEPDYVPCKDFGDAVISREGLKSDHPNWTHSHTPAPAGEKRHVAVSDAMVEAATREWRRVHASGEATGFPAGMRAAIAAALAAEPGQAVATRVRVPAGQTPLDDNLNHRFLDVIREGETARDNGSGSPYHEHSLEHCLHSIGWVQRDLRLALDAAKAHPLPPKEEIEWVLEDVRDNWLVYWEPNTARGHDRKASAIERLEALISRLRAGAQEGGGYDVIPY